MTQQDKGKNIFQSAIDAVSNRDEKAAVEAAMKHAQELERKLAETEKKLAEAEQRATQNAGKITSAEQLTGQTMQRVNVAEAKATQLAADLKKAQSDLTAVNSELAGTRNKLMLSEQILAATKAELQKYVNADQAKKIEEAAAAAAKAQTIAEHKVNPDDTLSALALKYYGSAGEAYWRLIYEANKEVIGDNPGRVRPGMMLKIPVLPEEMKKK